MSMEKKRFFEPWVPQKYEQGINGKKILVFGASYYCPKVNCPYYKDCTSIEYKDSSKYDERCPVYMATNRSLHDEPSYTTGETKAYSNFASLFQPYVKDEDVWEHLAFTNYVQYFLPLSTDASGKNFYGRTLQSHLSDRDFEAFIEVIQELKPDIVVFWGMVIEKPIRNPQLNKYLDGLDECFNNTEGYICYMKDIPGVDHDVALFNCYHPSSGSWWNSSLEAAAKYLNILLKNNDIQTLIC